MNENHFTVLTHANGTQTLVDSENGQAMHSRIGPEREAEMIYAAQAGIEDLLAAPGSLVNLYDVGMGTAANVIAVLSRLKDHSQGVLRIFSFELKPEGLRAALQDKKSFPFLERWRPEIEKLVGAQDGEKSQVTFIVGDTRVEWSLRVGDFYSHLENESIPSPDFIFFDFYSPKVVPELWSLESFMRLRKKIGDKASILLTYSASTPVRLHLLASGFFVGNGVSTGIKTETTVAATHFEKLTQPISKAWLRKLETSTSIADASYSVARDAVINHPQWGRAK